MTPIQRARVFAAAGVDLRGLGTGDLIALGLPPVRAAFGSECGSADGERSSHEYQNHRQLLRCHVSLHFQTGRRYLRALRGGNRALPATARTPFPFPFPGASASPVPQRRPRAFTHLRRPVASAPRLAAAAVPFHGKRIPLPAENCIPTSAREGIAGSKRPELGLSAPKDRRKSCEL